VVEAVELVVLVVEDIVVVVATGTANAHWLAVEVRTVSPTAPAASAVR